MAVSKRTRYEVLRRDNFTCRYCRSTDNAITIDHVQPVALGGTNDPSNLVAACRDCNAGKASSTPDASLVADVADLDMQWAAAVKRAADRAMADMQTQEEVTHWFLAEWARWDEEFVFLPERWSNGVHQWLAAGLPRPLLVSCLDTALRARHVKSQNVFAYMGGIARKQLEALHDAARAELDGET